MKNNIILAFVGRSGVGKSSIMKELLRIAPERFFVLKSLASRPKRDIDDDIFYRFISADLIRKMYANGEMVQYLEYAGNVYGCSRADIDSALKKGIGIQAYVEPAIFDLRDAGYEVVPIRIVSDKVVFRDENRVKLDDEREKIDVGVKLILMNSFQKGGLDKAVNELLKFIETL